MRIVLKHHSGWGWTFQYLESDGETPIICSGGTLAAEIRTEPGGPLLGSFQLEWLDEDNGIFSQRIEAAVVNEIPDGVHRSDVIFTDSNGLPLVIREDVIIKEGTITQPT